MARSCKAEALGRPCCVIRRNGPWEWMFIYVGHNLLMQFRFGARVSCQVEAKGHWDHVETRPTMDSGIFKRQSICAYPHHPGPAAAG